MSKTVSVTLGGNNYDVPQFSVDQHLRTIEALNGEPTKVAFGVLGIALERCNVADVTKVDASLEEIRSAVLNILVFAGYRTPAAPAAV
jgi:hypothetical protein